MTDKWQPINNKAKLFNCFLFVDRAIIGLEDRVWEVAAEPIEDGIKTTMFNLWIRKFKNA